MKRYITYILATMSLAWMVSCSTDDGLGNPNDAGHMALQFQSSTMTRSLDNTAGLNEDLIASIDCYFYPNGGENNDAVWYYHAEPNAKESYTISDALMPAGEMTKVFGTSTTGTMYVIANYTGNDLPTADNLAGSSIAELQQKVVSTTWPQGGANWKAQDSFVMDGQATITKAAGNAITGEVTLVRAAAKIELTITKVQSEIEGTDGCTYVPALEGGAAIGLTMHNAATMSSVHNEWSGSALTYNADSNAHTSLAGYTFTADGESYKQTHPFYSYPTHWGAGPSGEAYLLLVVPWQMTKDADGNEVTDQTAKHCYYEIPIGKLENNVISEHIERNNHYQISINVGTLGSFVQEEPVTLTPSYMVVDWTTGAIEAQVKDQRYLVVDQTSVVMNNVQEISIKYDSSHEVDVVAIETDNVAIETDNEVPVFDDYSVSVENGYITFTHELDNYHNANDQTYDYLPLTFTITVSHKDDPTFKETITVVQYPAMYVTWEEMKESTVFVNGNNSQSSGWWWVRGENGSNSPNMYTINIGAFDSTTADYIIADPREPANSNTFVFHETINANSAVHATAKDASEDNTLTGYRAAISGAESEHLVAPQLLWSSGYISNNGNGVQGAGAYNYQTNGKYRCAGYQENGYPAGRWRLPTPAEILYMARLCAEDKVARLFQDNQVYLSSNGGYKVDYDTRSVTRDGDTSTSVRCVYDIWYWKDKCAVGNFIWGAEGDLAEKDKSQYLVPVE